MTAMEVHNLIGLLIEVVLLAACGLALVALLVLFAVRFFDDSADLDVIGSHLTTPDGKAWDFSKDKYSYQARAQRDVKPGPDDEEEGGPDDTGEEAVIEFDTPDYSGAPVSVKTLKPKKQLHGDNWS